MREKEQYQGAMPRRQPLAIVGYLGEEPGTDEAIVLQDGSVWRHSGEVVPHDSLYSARTAAWNSVDNAIRAAADFGADETKREYAEESNVAEVLSLALRLVRIEMERGSGDRDNERLRLIELQLEQLFSVASKLRLGMAPGASKKAPLTIPKWAVPRLAAIAEETGTTLDRALLALLGGDTDAAGERKAEP